jgi:hypothetical protein
MELAGMVVMGEYPDGCICQVRGKPLAAAAAGAAVAAAAGVAMQTQAEQRQQAAAQRPR